MRQSIKAKLEAIRQSIENENVSYSELAELQSLAKYIDEGDTQLLEWAGVNEDEQNCDVCGKELYMDDDGNWVCEDDDIHNAEEDAPVCPECNQTMSYDMDSEWHCGNEDCTVNS